MSVMFTVFCSPLTCNTYLHYPFGADSYLHVAATPVMLQHSGLVDMNPGDAVRMESGETIAQWRKLFFEKFGVGITLPLFSMFTSNKLWSVCFIITNMHVVCMCFHTSIM